MGITDLRPAVPELRALANPGWLGDPSFFLDQLRPVGLLQRSLETERQPDWSFSSNEEAWSAILGEHVRASRLVHLSGFYLSEWSPRSPGVFHTRAGEAYRANAIRDIIEEPYEQDLAWIDHAEPREFEREVYGEGGALKYMRIFNPSGKLQMLRGGIGCIRLRRHTIGGEPAWPMSASSTLSAHEGLPLCVPDDLYQATIDSVASNGVSYCDSIIGTLRYVPDFLGDLYLMPDVPPVYLAVEEIRPGRPPDPVDYSKAMVSVAVSFESRSRLLGPRGMVFATYVTFFPGVKGSLQRRRDWLRDAYVAGRYEGKVISDFDEQVPRFGDAPFSLLRVLEGSVDIRELARPVSGDSTVRRALELYRDIHVTVSGDLVMGGKSVDESTVINIQNSTIHGPVAKTIQDSFNVVSTASADEDMKRLLGELHHAVVAMLEQAKAQGVVTEEEEETVARDLEALAREAVAANPRRKWYQLNAESLRDAATKLGEIGTPVLDVTARVLALLA